MATTTYTLDQINAMLQSAGSTTRLAREDMTKILQEANRDTFFDNLVRASRTKEQNARTYLRTIFVKIGLLSQATANKAMEAGREQTPPASNDRQQRTANPAPAGEESAIEDPDAQHEESGRMAQEDRFNFHVYGKSGALCFETDVTQGSDRRPGIPTVKMEAASSVRPREYDWSNKIIIQFTRAELPVVLMVLHGMLPKCEFKNHGPGKDKGFEMEYQPDNKGVFVKVFAKDKPLKTVPISFSDVLEIKALMLKQLAIRWPWMGIDAVITELRYTATLAAGGR